jgi:hypothetical protein
MNQFKKVLLSAFATLAIFGTTLVSCTSDPCDPKTIVCLNGGACTDGKCGCVGGFEGTTCQTKTNEKFVALYSASDVRTAPTAGTPFPYAPQIFAGNTNTTLLIDKFYDGFFNNKINATANASTITIASQDPDVSGFSVAGSGTLVSNTLTWNYTITRTDTLPNITKTYQGTWTK